MRLSRETLHSLKSLTLSNFNTKKLKSQDGGTNFPKKTSAVPEERQRAGCGGGNLICWPSCPWPRR
ncbi:MAG TPA: hypothetical protein H9833_02825 [Candidatus Evtepia faecavium]|nr:hypothetical protein [Candidatus Evtepia faecavium]